MKTCLVLEGGAMRGIYTTAILDKFLENDIFVDCIIGVSAGALFGINYCSKQKGRGIRYNLKYINEQNYIGINNLIKTGNIVNEDFCFHKIPEELDAFDNETFSKSKTDFYATVTNVVTGKAEYIKTKDAFKDVELFRATGAMPFVSKIVEFNGNSYLDGALTDSIPVMKAIEMGYDKVIVVLTKPEGYRKKKPTSIPAKVKYKKYPNLINAINTRYKMYNKTMTKLEKLEQDKDIFVFRPSRKIKMSRLEKDKEKIQELYDLGLSDFDNKFRDLNKYLDK